VLNEFKPEDELRKPHFKASSTPIKSADVVKVHNISTAVDTLGKKLVSDMENNNSSRLSRS